jgi:hypothetical protein
MIWMAGKSGFGGQQRQVVVPAGSWNSKIQQPWQVGVCRAAGVSVRLLLKCVAWGD